MPHVERLKCLLNSSVSPEQRRKKILEFGFTSIIINTDHEKLQNWSLASSNKINNLVKGSLIFTFPLLSDGVANRMWGGSNFKTNQMGLLCIGNEDITSDLQQGWPCIHEYFDCQLTQYYQEKDVDTCILVNKRWSIYSNWALEILGDMFSMPTQCHQ